MEADELMDDDLFADLYGEDEPPKTSLPAPVKVAKPASPVNTPAAAAPAVVPQRDPEASYSQAQQPQEPAAPQVTAQRAIDPRAPPPSVNVHNASTKIENPYAAEDDADNYSGWDAAAATGGAGAGGHSGQGGHGIHSNDGGSCGYDGMGAAGYGDPQATGSPAIKEDGKMFIGGLNWETTDESLKEYFSQYGEVVECTVMRDGPTGRSRGFGFLTFKDPKTVNIVMVKEHYLDGKIIDPKRAIPRDEQEKTSKIFVGGVSQEATETDFREYFTQFGRVLDATLMMDKDTGRPRGFGFVTFDSEGAVENALNCPTLAILDKPIEVKKAQPRGNIRERMNAHFDERDDRGGSFRDRGDRRDRFENRDNGNNGNGNYNGGSSQNQNAPAGQQNIYNGISPQMMAQYYQNFQRYMQAMQSFGRGGGGPMPAMNPAIMQALGRGGGAMNAMNPAMLQQLQQMQQLQLQQQLQQQGQQQQGQPQQSQMGGAGSQGPQSQQQVGYGSPNQPVGYPHTQGVQQSQQVQSYDPSSYNDQNTGYRHRNFQHHPSQRDYQPPQTQPSSWEGMYDDVPPQQQQQQQQQQQGRGRNEPFQQSWPSNYDNWDDVDQATGVGRAGNGFDGPPPNAPTGPRNAKGSGSNYRGGGRGGVASVRGVAAGSGGVGAGGAGPDRPGFVGGAGGYARGGGGYHPYARNTERY
ncbi:unnamed protein product [Tuber melanosporum]|uniref:(Perigord truffle) hypothetical protein n=1 Tax=Tuber melanosporum (strain Mel28) TaxID=656061 RepID=D5GBN8_TUBMM|nr:uncharacterized protein GSTUM_00005496001 [Tuber melanosporum]CAZ81888.1 unnamed protein product [Tuber melanosporum]